MAHPLKHFDHVEFLTPFDQLADELMRKSFPHFSEEFGVDFFHKGSYPKVNIIEYSDRVTVESEIPGLTKENLKIKVENHILTLSGTKQEVREDKGNAEAHKVILKELKRSNFKRSFGLVEGHFEENKVTAKFENGLLLVTIPKKKKDDVTTGFAVEIS